MKNWKNLKHIFVAWWILMIIIFWIVRIFGSDFFVPITHFFVYREASFQNFIYRYHWNPSKDIVLIKIDETSLNALQANGNLKMLTIPKSKYIQLVQMLEGVWVKGIAFDIVFQNADPDEQKFADVLSRYKNIVLAASQGSGSCIKDKDSEIQTCGSLPRSIYENIPWWWVDMDSNNDRRFFVSSLSGTTYGSDKKIFTLPLALFSLWNPGYADRFQNDEVYLASFFWWAHTYPEFSFVNALDASSADFESMFRGKYVFIGESGTLIHDSETSPVSWDLMDGVDTHAHLLDGFLQNRLLKPVNPVLYYIIIAFLGLLSIIAYLLLPNITSPLLAIFLTFFVIWISRYLYFHAAIVIDIFPLFCVTGFLAFPVTFIYRFFVIDGEKRKLTSAFSHYIDPTLVKQIADNAKDIYLGGESRELTVLFSDIAGFTTISEKLDPKDLFSLMSSYLSRMTDILIKNGWTLDKYIGDAVMGFFWAPISEIDHALRSCRTALAMRATLPEFNTEIVSHGLAPIDFRIGIASGEVLVGNIGSHDRFNYTVLGDTVNLASRLEATSKEYGTHILVAEPTYLFVKDDFFFRKLDCIAVKWKTLWVSIYELIADIRDVSFDRKKYEVYETALALYFSEKYLEAGKLWESNMSDDAPSEIMAKRCVEILKWNVIVEGWVFHMTHK